MADNVQITAGSGTTIRAVDVGGVEYQVVIPADSSGNLIASVLVNSVRAQATAVVNDVATKGNMLLGDLTTGARPVFIGGQVRAGMAQYDISGTGDARFQSLSLTANGRLLTLEGAPPEDKGLPTPVLAPADTNAHTLIPAPVSTVLLELDALEIVNTSTSVSYMCILFNGATEIYRAAVPTSPGRLPFRLPNPPRCTKGVAMNFQFAPAPGANTVWLMPHYHITQE